MSERLRVAIERWLLVLLGAALEWASLPPGPWPWLAFAADAPFLWLLWHRGGARWKRWAFLYGLVRFGWGLRWLHEIGPLQGIGAPVALATVQLLWGLSIRIAVKRRVPYLFVVPLTAVLEEWLRTVWLGGMPWPTRSLALTAWEPLVGFSSQLGAYGLSFLAALSSAWVSGLPSAFRAGLDRRFLVEVLLTRGVLVAGTVAVAAMLGGARVAEVEQRMSVGPTAITAPFVAIQGNVAQSLKHSGRDEDSETIFARHERLTAQALAANPGAFAVLWPETMIPWPFVDADLAQRFPDAWQSETNILYRLRALVPPGSHAEFLVGANYYFVGRKGRQEALYDHDTKDSVFFVDPAAATSEPPVPRPDVRDWRPPWEKARHDKVILVPGGEYTPLGDWIPPLRRFKEDMSSIPELTPGDDRQEPFFFDIRAPDRPHGETENHEILAGTVVCYEIAFPARCRTWRRQGATVLLNSGNYGWFGDTGMPAQVLALAKLRAAELNVTVVVAGNTGPTAILDPAGRVVRQLEVGGKTQFVEGWIAAPLYSDLYVTRYAAWGDVPWAVLGVLAALLGWWRGRSRLAPPETPGDAPSESPGVAATEGPASS